MKVPAGGRGLEEVRREIQSWLDEHCERGSDDSYYCKGTGVRISQTMLRASVHIAEFGDQHAGMGRVLRIPLPFCSVCEDEPSDAQTCVHVPIPLVREE